MPIGDSATLGRSGISSGGHIIETIAQTREGVPSQERCVTMSEPTHEQVMNSRSFERLADVAGRLDDGSLRIVVREGWTAASLLLHIAFWDRFVAERWRHAGIAGLQTPQPIEDHVTDMVNEALLPLLIDVPVGLAAQTAVAAARQVDGLIGRLPPDIFEAVRSEGRRRLLDRSLHRAEHLDEIMTRGIGTS